MKFKSYQGRSLAEVLPQIREELGPDAVILKQRVVESGGVAGLFAKRGIEVLAADHAPATAPAPAPAPAGGATATLPRPAQAPAAASTDDESADDLLRRTFADALAARERREAALDAAPPAPAPAQPRRSAAGASAAAAYAQAGTAPDVRPFEPLRLESVPAPDGGLAVRPARREDPALDVPAPAPRPLRAVAPAPEPLDDEASDVLLELERSGVEPERASALVDAARLHLRPFDARPLRDLVRDLIATRVRAEHGWTPDGSPRRIAVIGPSGAGKTTAVAALAAAYGRAGLAVGIVAVDAPGDVDGGLAHRLGGDAERALAYVGGSACLRVASAADAARALVRLGACDVVLLDLPAIGGRDETAEHLLGDAILACQPHEVHAAVPLGIAPREADAVLARAARLGANRLLVTKTDEARFAGPLFDLADRSALPLSYLSSGRRVPDALAPANGVSIAHRILPI